MIAAMATSGVRAGDIVYSVGRLILIIVASIALRPAVDVVLRAAGRAPGDGPTVAVVAVLTLLASAATQAMGLEAVVGAFAAGIVISGCGALDRERLASLQTVVLMVLAPIFFATAGLRMDLSALVHPTVLLSGIAVLAVAILGKFAGAYAGARLTRLGHWEGLALGAGMNARGVIEVIIAMVGLRLGVLGPEMYTIIVLVAIVTSLMAPPILRSAMSKVEHTAEEQLRQQAFQAPEADRARRPVID
jgi:Kef-type K+ transport system membrane component KefB